MAININTALQIDELKNSGKSIREIADSLKLNREMVRRYLIGEIKISSVNTDTELTQNRHNTTNNTTDTLTQGNVSIKEFNDFKEEIKNYLIDLLSNYQIELTKEDINNFKKEILKTMEERLKPIEIKLFGLGLIK